MNPPLTLQQGNRWICEACRQPKSSLRLARALGKDYWICDRCDVLELKRLDKETRSELAKVVEIRRTEKIVSGGSTTTLRGVLDRFSEMVGGDRGVAERLFQNMEAVRMDEDKAHITAKYDAMLLDAIGRNDKLSQDSFSSMTEGELKDVLRPLCIDMMKNDIDFRGQILQACGLLVESKKIDG